MKLNDYFEMPFSFTQKQVELFAKVTGDYNPIHLDDEYASKSIFKKKIMHGFLSASVFSKIIGMHFPGNGAVYLSQTMNFLQPMYAGMVYKAKVKVAECIEMKNRFVLETYVYNSNEEITLDGKATIQYKE